MPPYRAFCEKMNKNNRLRTSELRHADQVVGHAVRRDTEPSSEKSGHRRDIVNRNFKPMQWCGIPAPSAAGSSAEALEAQAAAIVQCATTERKEPAKRQAGIDEFSSCKCLAERSASIAPIFARSSARAP